MANCLPSLMPIEWYVEQQDSKEKSRKKIKDSAYHAVGKLNHNVNANGQSVNANGQSVKENKPNRAADDTKGNKASSATGKKETDITRCHIRERVIQMLAVKPLKRLEIITRLQNEGLRGSERVAIGTILRDVALFRDNVYVLRCYIWNNVKDDWPFYSEQERQQLQTNKQQNSAPPVSSVTASLTSGQALPSPNSSSPPQPATDCDSNGGNGLKRPNQEYYAPFPSKKRRISHLSKERVGNQMNPNNADTLLQHRNVHALKGGEEASGIIDCVTNTSKKRTEIIKKLEVPVSLQPRKSNSGNNKEESQTKTDLSENSNKHSSSSRSKETTRKSTSKKDKEESTSKIHVHPKPEKTPVPKSTNRGGLEAANCVKKENFQHRQHGDSQQQLEQEISAQHIPEEPQLQLQQQHSTTISADTANPHGFDFSAYVPIRSVEERRVYKAEFERDHAEYSQLLEHVKHVRRGFETLASLLEQLPPCSPKFTYVNQQIIAKYELLNTREEKQRMQRFIYLHYKLEHITLAVCDYDKKLTSIPSIPEMEEIISLAVNASTDILTNSTQPNGHGLAMDTNSKAEAEIVQPLEVPPQNMKQLKTNREECEPRNDHSEDQNQLKNVVGISSREAAPNRQEEDSSSSESSDDSSGSSSESSGSDDSSDSESSDDSSQN